ncbi:MAG TPA: CHAD domain-containing protein [Asticcacaulis sp.]|nr:CHAD domain-containing protein [Asticcacaulis sp.]
MGFLCPERFIPAMKTRFKRKEAPGDGLNRLILGQIDEIARIPAGAETAVHDIRVACKKIRAYLRLMRDGLGEVRFDLENRTFRDLARLFRAFRDRQTEPKTLAGLQPSDSSAAEVVRQQLEAHPTGNLSGTFTAARSIAKKARGRFVDGKLEPDAFSLKAAYQHSYGRVRKAFDRARRHPGTARLHEWRKQVKAFGYQIKLLKKTWPEQVKLWTAEFDALAQKLGDDHDLAVLAATLSADHDAEPVVRPVLKSLMQRRGDLQYSALEIADPLLAEKPRAFATGVGHHWKKWRN